VAALDAMEAIQHRQHMEKNEKNYKSAHVSSTARLLCLSGGRRLRSLGPLHFCDDTMNVLGLKNDRLEDYSVAVHPE